MTAIFLEGKRGSRELSIERHDKFINPNIYQSRVGINIHEFKGITDPDEIAKHEDEFLFDEIKKQSFYREMASKISFKNKIPEGITVDLVTFLNAAEEYLAFYFADKNLEIKILTKKRVRHETITNYRMWIDYHLSYEGLEAIINSITREQVNKYAETKKQKE